MRIDRTTGVLFQTDTALDAAARALLAAFGLRARELRLFSESRSPGRRPRLRRERRPASTAAVRHRASNACIITGNFIPAQRDVLLERALAWKADVLVMCDDDMVLSPNALRQILRPARSGSRNAALAGALYYSRDGFRPMVVDRWDENDTPTAVIPAFDREPVPVDGVGFGCVALRVSRPARADAAFFRGPHTSSNAAPAGCAYATRTISSARAFGKLGIACFSTPACAAVTTIASRAPLRPRPGSRRKLRDGNAWPRWLTATRCWSRARPAPTSTTESHVRANVDYVIVP